MLWWHWLLPWRWPWFKRRKAARQAVQDKFHAALNEAQKRHVDLTEAVEKLREGREQRITSLSQPPRLPLNSQ